MTRLAKARSAALVERVERRIFLIRGEKVMLDSDLAEMYGVVTKTLNRAVRRNRERFPSDFMFELRVKEIALLRYQFGTSNAGRGGRRYRPFVFTEQGVAMLSSVLHSDRAIQVNIAIMRAFVRLRRLLATHRDLARKLDELEQKYDKRFAVVFVAIRRLMAQVDPPRRRIGF
ncbi:MAG: DNA-binding protein [Gemmatimonadetes bacterium]|nr:MAG: DNA-binding protein [Gemmatimonadota bacterium]